MTTQRRGNPSVLERKPEDQFYWYINDVLKMAEPHAIFLPMPFEKCWKEYSSIQEWVKKKVQKHLNTNQLKKDWRAFRNSPEPDIELKRISSLEHCQTAILDIHEFAAEKDALPLSDAIKAILPTLWNPPKPENYPVLMTYAQAAILLPLKEETIRKYKKRGKLKGPKGRGSVTRASVFAYLEGHE